MNVEVGTCPICKIPLTVSSELEQVQSCKKCNRSYYPVEQRQPSKIIYDDIESVTQEGESSPVLLCDDSDNRFFRPKQKENYLQKYFGSHVAITTREVIPT